MNPLLQHDVVLLAFSVFRVLVLDTYFLPLVPTYSPANPVSLFNKMGLTNLGSKTGDGTSFEF